MSRALHHMQNPDLALLEMNNVLKINGEMYISITTKIFFEIYDKSPLFREILKNYLKELVKGRKFFSSDSSSDLIRQFDGKENPIGWAGKREDIENLLPRDLKFLKSPTSFH